MLWSSLASWSARLKPIFPLPTMMISKTQHILEKIYGKKQKNMRPRRIRAQAKKNAPSTEPELERARFKRD